MQVIEEKISEKEFNDLIEEGFVLVDFYANWCMPCQLLSPLIDRISKDTELEKVKFIKINIENNPELARKFKVMSIPNVILFKNGQELDRFIGFMPEAKIKEWLLKRVK
ncbi:MAG: thioredoxin [Candidatus Pacearchaeota archaeon]